MKHQAKTLILAAMCVAASATVGATKLLDGGAAKDGGQVAIATNCTLQSVFTGQSYCVRTILPCYGIGNETACHNHEFRTACSSEVGVRTSSFGGSNMYIKEINCSGTYLTGYCIWWPARKTVPAYCDWLVNWNIFYCGTKLVGNATNPGCRAIMEPGALPPVPGAEPPGIGGHP